MATFMAGVCIAANCSSLAKKPEDKYAIEELYDS